MSGQHYVWSAVAAVGSQDEVGGGTAELQHLSVLKILFQALLYARNPPYKQRASIEEWEELGTLSFTALYLFTFLLRQE